MIRSTSSIDMICKSSPGNFHWLSLLLFGRLYSILDVPSWFTKTDQAWEKCMECVAVPKNISYLGMSLQCLDVLACEFFWVIVNKLNWFSDHVPTMHLTLPTRRELLPTTYWPLFLLTCKARIESSRKIAGAVSFIWDEICSWIQLGIQSKTALIVQNCSFVTQWRAEPPVQMHFSSATYEQHLHSRVIIQAFLWAALLEITLWAEPLTPPTCFLKGKRLCLQGSWKQV